MAHVAVDTNFMDSAEAVELGRRLESRFAWCHVVRLWAWAIDQGLEDGMLYIDNERIAEVSSFRGDSNLYVESLVAVGLLRAQSDGSYYMAGWSRNSEFFKKKNRMKAYRQRKKAERNSKDEASREAQQETSQETSPVPSREPRSPSPSPPPPRVIEEKKIVPDAQSVAAPTTPPQTLQVVSPVVLKLDGRAGASYDVTEKDITEWRAAYPAIRDIEAEVRAAREWLRSNPANAKSNIRAFLVRWLKKAQDNAPRVGPGNQLTRKGEEIRKVLAASELTRGGLFDDVLKPRPGDVLR